MNIVNVSLFTPCLLFSKVAFNLTPAKLKELWIIPAIFVVVTATSMLVGWTLGHAFRLKRSQRYVQPPHAHPALTSLFTRLLATLQLRRLCSQTLIPCPSPSSSRSLRPFLLCAGMKTITTAQWLAVHLHT